MALFSPEKLRKLEARAQHRVVEKAHTILIVDDEAPNRRILVGLLSDKHHLIEARDGVHALEVIGARDYPGEISLVISDHRMPRMTGTQLLERLEDELPRAKRIILTAYADMDVILDVINRCQIYQFIQKPFDRADLILTVSRALEAYDLERRLEEHRRDLERKVDERTRELLSQEKLASLGRLTAGLAHELRNPLNFVQPMAETLPQVCHELGERLTGLGVRNREVSGLVAELEEGLQIIGKNARRAESIVNRMVRLTSEGARERVPVDLHRLIEEHARLALHAVQAEREGFRVVMDFQLEPGTARMLAVEQNIRRLLINLLENAMEALLEKRTARPDFVPRLLLAVRDIDGKRLVVIRDNGPGIPPEIRDQILEPFVTNKPPNSGHTGLGLFICYDIARDHGATLEIESEEGKFTEARIIFTNPEGPNAPAMSPDRPAI